MSRDLCEVIDHVQEVLGELKPFDRESYHETLVGELDKLNKTAMYVAPESLGPHWGTLDKLLSTTIGKPDKQWKIDIYNIVKGGHGDIPEYPPEVERANRAYAIGHDAACYIIQLAEKAAGDKRTTKALIYSICSGLDRWLKNNA